MRTAPADGLGGLAPAQPTVHTRCEAEVERALVTLDEVREAAVIPHPGPE